MINQATILALLAAAMSVPAGAGSLEGDYLYRITTVRAAPGRLSDLIDAFRASGANSGDQPAHGPMLMRHSQGDQWDLMVVTPIKNFADYFGKDPTQPRSIIPAKAADAIAFEEDVFALGPEPEVFRSAWKENSFYHIEMFAAVAGGAARLTEQRRMENRYLAATGQVPNMIFRRVAGSDIDVFTIGFHESLEAFAAPAPASDADKESAAKKAGFKDRADISFYLRSLISSHHDTFAVRVD